MKQEFEGFIQINHRENKSRAGILLACFICVREEHQTVIQVSRRNRSIDAEMVVEKGSTWYLITHPLSIVNIGN